jgi:hypothetical protein
MTAPTRLWLFGIASIAFSIYIGVEIDYRHWTWIVFLILVPSGVAAVLILLARRKTRRSDGRD